jgi:hypothetical protein
LLAGLRQTICPEFTADGIFGIKGTDPWPIVQELGFANLSMGMLGIISIADSGLARPSAIVSGLFFGIAGIRHVFRRNMYLAGTIAMVSDVFLFAVLLAYLILEARKG